MFSSSCINRSNFFRAAFLWVGLVTSALFSGQIRVVDSGIQEFAQPEGRTMEEAKQWVIEQAQIRAMAEEFGMRVQSETVHVVAESNGSLDDSFTELNTSQVQGEWLETKTLEGPTMEVRDGELWWSVRVKGKARPLRKDAVEMDFALVSDLFGLQRIDALGDGERIRARFRVPVDGHVMFFYQESGVVHALSNSDAQLAAAVKGQRTYSLFSTEAEWLEAEGPSLDRLSRYSWGFKVTNPDMIESTALLVGVFARQAFPPPNMDWNEEDEMWSLDEEAFDRWVKQGAGRLDGFQVERVPIRIQPKTRY